MAAVTLCVIATAGTVVFLLFTNIRINERNRENYPAARFKVACALAVVIVSAWVLAALLAWSFWPLVGLGLSLMLYVALLAIRGQLCLFSKGSSNSDQILDLRHRPVSPHLKLRPAVPGTDLVKK